MEITVKQQNGLYKLVDGVFTCMHENTTTEEYIFYQPSQEQIDKGTDQDEYREALVCLGCGKDVQFDF